MVLPKTCSTPHYNLKTGSLQQLRQETINQQPTTPSTSSIPFADQFGSIGRTPDARDSAPDKSDTQATETYQCRSLSSKPQSQTTAATGPSTSPSMSRPFPSSSVAALLSSVFSPPNFIPLSLLLLHLFLLFESCVSPQPSTRLDDPAPPLPSPRSFPFFFSSSQSLLSLHRHPGLGRPCANHPSIRHPDHFIIMKVFAYVHKSWSKISKVVTQHLPCEFCPLDQIDVGVEKRTPSSLPTEKPSSPTISFCDRNTTQTQTVDVISPLHPFLGLPTQFFHMERTSNAK